MPVYASSETLYKNLQTLFEALRAQTPSPVEAMANARLLLRLKIAEPTAEVTFDGRLHPVKIYYGNGHNLRPELDVSLNADTLHKILLNELSLKKAVATRQVKVLGPVWKTNSLGLVLEQGRALYPQIFAQQ